MQFKICQKLEMIKELNGKGLNVKPYKCIFDLIMNFNCIYFENYTF